MYAMEPGKERVIPMTKIAASILAIVVAACSSPTPATSSSSHWVACTTMAECASLATAAACTGGYCVDSQGQKIESGGTTTTTPGPCDPLAPHELAVTLGTVLGVGKDLGGTTYMADHVQATSTDRVFISEGTSLVRKRVIGSGSRGGPPDADYTFTVEEGLDAATARALLIQQRGGVVTAMGLAPAGGKGFIGDPGIVFVSLTVLDSSTLSTFTLRNLPGDVTVEYVADVMDGHIIVVTRPTDDAQDSDFRLFYGSSEGAMAEQHIVNISRLRSGGADIEFQVNGATYTVSFSWILDVGDSGTLISHPGPATLETGGQSIPVSQRFPTPTTLPGFSFTCR